MGRPDYGRGLRHILSLLHALAKQRTRRTDVVYHLFSDLFLLILGHFPATRAGREETTMKQKITLFFTWICAVVTAFVLRAVLREQRNMIMAGMYQHPHYETLKKHRETLFDNLDRWGYTYRHGNLRRK